MTDSVKGTDNTTREKYTCNSSLTYVTGLFMQRDIGGGNPRFRGSQVVAVVLAFSFLIVISTYSAALTASKVSTNDNELPITGFKVKFLVD